MPRLDLLKEDAQRALRGVPVDLLVGKTVLITGASGIVGTHLLYALHHCQTVLGLPVQVVGVVRRTPAHLAPLSSAGRLRFLEGDLVEPHFLGGLPEADFIVHAATYGQPGRFLAEAAGTLRLNTTVTFALLERLRPGGGFLFLSSSEVYSGLGGPPFTEDQIGTTGPTHPRACYIEGKRCGEAICQAHRDKGAAVRAARLSLAYGPGIRPGDQRVLHSFIERGLREGVIRLRDRGEARRTYCYVADAAHMLWRILLEGKQLLYNVGGTSRTTIAELATLVGGLLETPVVFPAPAEAGGAAGAPDEVCLDLTRFREEFGAPDYLPLSEGVARTIAWQRSLCAAAGPQP
jgi:nucleoside-diphosphate-sugar epimerase